MGLVIEVPERVAEMCVKGGWIDCLTLRRLEEWLTRHCDVGMGGER
jgi:hypothetical protein